MAISKLDQVLEDVKSLTPEEQEKVRALLDSMLEKKPAAITEEEFERRLLEKGIISRIPPPITDFAPYKDRKPIEVKGKPLSEIIIEERR